MGASISVMTFLVKYAPFVRLYHAELQTATCHANMLSLNMISSCHPLTSLHLGHLGDQDEISGQYLLRQVKPPFSLSYSLTQKELSCTGKPSLKIDFKHCLKMQRLKFPIPSYPSQWIDYHDSWSHHTKQISQQSQGNRSNITELAAD